jgi:hypothetical protein
MNNGSCDQGLHCQDGTCQTCPAGDPGCPCDAGACHQAGQICTDGVCVDNPCAAGTDGCPCDGDRCDDPLVCGGDSICRACSNDMAGCACADHACQNHLVCDADSDKCRDEKRCSDHPAPCGDHQRCEDGEEGEDATCPTECDDGFRWNPDTASCEAFVAASCGDGADSIAAECAHAHRTCDEPLPGQATCGLCVAGYVDDGGACRTIRDCTAVGCAAQNRACTAMAGADAVCGTCLPGYSEQNGNCVANASCDALDCAANHRSCGGTPPRCGSCAEGYTDVNGECQAAPSCDPDAPNSIAAQCAADDRVCTTIDGEAVCGECVDGSLQNPDTGECEQAVYCAELGCEALGRTCSGEPFATCGDCQAGTSPDDPNDSHSACHEAATCADIVCPDNEFCVEAHDGQAAGCFRSQCGPGQAYRIDTDECVQCDIQCGEEGETGNIWPYTMAFSTDCLCETQTGYYADVSGAVRARPCDADGDGWVRVSAQASIESDDPTVADNARCSLRKIDRFTLKNEYGQSLDVRSCADGWVSDPNEICATDPVPLYESVRNDDQNEMTRAVATDAPTYEAGGNGRALRADEVNPLTKACVSINADYNDDLQSDASEYQEATPSANLETALKAFVPFSYFVELERGYYVAPGAGETYGSYVIEERSRCSDSFPLQYADGEGTYWKQCTRNRDSSYDSDLSSLTPIGFDFARFDCDAASGACPLLSPVSEAGDADEIPTHGLCQLTTLPPADGIWRGMNHHSQFKCAIISAANEIPAVRNTAPERLLASELYNGAQDTRKYQFNQCHIACPDGDTDCTNDCSGTHCATSSQTPGGLANPSRPVVECEPVLQDLNDTTIAARQVGFVSVRYTDSPGNYVRGCVDEWDPSASDADTAAITAWKDLCPGYAANPDAVTGVANPTNFGKLVCGCGLNYGGPSCNIGCPRSAMDTDGDHILDQDVGPLMYGGPSSNSGGTCIHGYCPVAATDDGGGGRRGYWVCGGFTATTYEPPANDSTPHLSGGGFEIHGGVTLSPFSADRLCQNGDCSTGFSLQKGNPMDRDH